MVADILGTLFILGTLAGVIAFVVWHIRKVKDEQPDLLLMTEQFSEVIPSTIEEAGQAEVAVYERHQLSKVGL